MGKKISLGLIVLSVIILAAYFLTTSKTNETKNENLAKLKIGWQIPWATQGQLTQVLKNTEILKKNGLEGEFKGFTYGPPLNEAALAGEVDVIFTADQPAAALISKNPKWKIVGRLMYNRVSLYVPPKSPIQNVSDLKGRTVGMPFGAAVQRMVLKAETDNGLDPKKDVNNVNLAIAEQIDLVKNADAEKWGNMDALGGFDPTPAMLEEKGLVRNIAEGKIVSVIVMNTDYIEKNPNAPVQFLKAFKQAYEYYAGNVEKANNWFNEGAKLNFSSKALEKSAAIEPNTKGQNIYLDFTDEDYTIMQEAADFMLNQGLIKNKVIMRDHIDLSYLGKALK